MSRATARHRYDLLAHSVHPRTVFAAFLILGASAALAITTDVSWWCVVLGITGPDLTFLVGVGDKPLAPGLMPRRAVPFYNAVHRYLAPLGSLAVAAAFDFAALAVISLAWLSHIVWDRGVGYTLRSSDGALTGREC